MEILYVKATGKVIAIQDDGFAWGKAEVDKNGLGIPPFALLHRSMPVPIGPPDCLVVKGNSVKVILPDADPEPEVHGGD